MFLITSVERDTGIGRDRLRVWERRYGFPIPVRNKHGKRVYSEQQIRTLQLIKRLLDQGMHPGKLVGLSDSQLNTISQDLSTKNQLKLIINDRMNEFIDCVYCNDTQKLWGLLEQTLIQQGLKTFIIESLAPLITTVGDQWAAGHLNIFEEHFITHQITLFLDSTISKIPVISNTSPVLLATFPGENHNLGLLMIECLLKDKGQLTVNLGIEVPMDQLVMACQRYKSKVILLSFSSAYSNSGLRTELNDLAQQIPDHISVYVGGSGVKKMRKFPKQVILTHRLQNILDLDFS
ncbi:MAG: MerR family transcriptional regulator [Gammaproteobacteria bacterium]|nr:MerR family transcriptional regulator [Gammaproteobacteria bacterium]